GGGLLLLLGRCLLTGRLLLCGLLGCSLLLFWRSLLAALRRRLLATRHVPSLILTRLPVKPSRSADQLQMPKESIGAMLSWRPVQVVMAGHIVMPGIMMLQGL